MPRPNGPGIRRYSTVQMAAVRPPPRLQPEPEATQMIGRMLDDELGFDLDLDLAADDDLELDCLPSSHRPRLEQPRQSSYESSTAARSSSGEPASRPMSRPREDAPPSRAGGAPPSSRAGGAPPSRTSSRGIPAVAVPPSTRAAALAPAVDAHAAILAFAGYGTRPASVVGMPGYAFRVLARKRVLRGDLARARLRSSPDVGLYEAALRATDEGAVRTGLLVASMMVTLVLLAAATVYQVMSSGLPFLK